MAENDTSRAGGGGTSGTGEPEASAKAGGEERSDRTSEAKSESLAGGDDSVDAAIGGGGHIAGTGSSVARSGRLTSEGGPPVSTAPDPGDPGGMGGVRSRPASHDRRPPGGVSPIEDKNREKQET